MSYHSSGTRFNRYSLPSFLEAVIDATEKEIVDTQQQRLCQSC